MAGLVKDFLINTPLGLVIVQADNAEEALVNYWVEELDLSKSFLTRGDLLRMGYRVVIPTKHKEIYQLER